jgi:diguanylate cyclase (GGDEF)-like protein
MPANGGPGANRPPARIRPPLSGDESVAAYRHPRTIGWIGTSALAMGGSNQSLFLIAALFAGQGDIPGQGSAAVLLLIMGLVLSFAAAPGWTELVMMSPDRVGGIAGACKTAFQPYSPVLAALAGVCYWWGWLPTCGLTAILSAAAINQWCLPGAPVPLIACSLVVFFAAINLAGVSRITEIAVPIAVASAGFALVSMVAPVVSGHVDWGRAVDFHLTTPFQGWFGALTSLMAGLYLVGFGAPAFEAALCHVGETVDPDRNVPRAMMVNAAMAAVYFCALPVIWLGALGPAALGDDLSNALGPTFAPVFGVLGKSAAIGFMMFNMFHGTMQPLAGAARTLSQLAEDGLAPRFLALRLSTDAPLVATLLTAGFAILFLLIGDPIWLVAAANFTYLIGICLPSIAVWLLRRDAPTAHRPYRAPRGLIVAGVGAAIVWGVSAVLGFEQFGLPTVVFGLLMAYSGAALYGLRKLEDRRRLRLPGVVGSLHVKLTGAMVFVLGFDAVGYILAVDAIPSDQKPFVAALEDIFVVVALMTISVGIVLPGMIANSADQVSRAAKRLASTTLEDFASAMLALSEGNLEAAHVSVDIEPVVVRSRDELGAMAESFNALQLGIKRAAIGLDGAREGLGRSRAELLQAKESALHDASHDQLTGLANRTLFIDRLTSALASRDDRGGDDWAVLFIDLDGFKIVNDSLGHGAGNRLIVQVAARLRALLRRDDESPTSLDHPMSRALLARMGGDEFTVLLWKSNRAEYALSAAARIQDALAAPFCIEGQEVHTSASIGIVLGCAEYATPDDILRDADLAMYRAKTLGKARAEIFVPSMLVQATARLRLESDLRRALRDDEFVLHYQPIVFLETERIVGFEALVRWQVPGAGLVYPGDFVSAAEETGLIVPLGMLVLRQACLTARAWQQELNRRPPLTVSVNLSPRQFSQPNLVRNVQTILAETKVDPGLIKLELTESSTMAGPERALRVLGELKSLGLQLSMDDFGTGYSSLSYLQRFPIDILKIDRSFVVGSADNSESRQIVTTILALAKGMRMEVVAEGIETREQLLEMRRLGVEFGQGYFFAKPLPLAEATAMLRAPRNGRAGLAA